MSFFFRFLSLAIVIPFLTKEPSIYGIYAICISLTIFLNYADLGFLKAIRKYATECYSSGQVEDELKLHGFATFILIINLSVIFIIFLYISKNPSILINDITDENSHIASNLLFILSVSIFTLVPKKLCESIFRIRLDNYIYKIIFLIASSVTILSSFYFFRTGVYDIVGYFIFLKIIELVSVLSCLFVIKRKYAIKLIDLRKHIKYNSLVYEKVSKLSYSSLYTLFAWVLFYELDQVIIGKFYGSYDVAMYSIGLTLPVILRSVIGIMYTPINEKTNLLIGEGRIDKLKILYEKILVIYTPIIISICLIGMLSINLIIPLWVGGEYEYSIYVSIILSAGFLMSFITYPIDILFLATEQVKKLYLYSTLLPVILWGGFFLFHGYIGFITVAIFKVIATVLIQVLYIRYYINFIDIKLTNFIEYVFKDNIYTIIFIITFTQLLSYIQIKYEYLQNLYIIILFIGIITLFSLLISYYTNQKLKISLNNIYRQLVN